ncbi:hypothetical protein SERLA73DRAFT_72739 [Serpula lacrymans var. lacrymans S7.3]|uniref:Mediator complex subunit 1 n=1 Tax=Serpula lacrymans var. lacrymans (strain S7.3) TaxID=936435 RepID=F8PU39_SERL3|nr:hypothetical protein SERLA73DRAFT_72739 [Serpula lacrymans var. lacrymans S7.3]
MSLSNQASISDTPPTLLSTLQNHSLHNDLFFSKSLSSSQSRLSPPHPFSVSSETHVASLRDLIGITNQLAHSLDNPASLAIQDPKLLSLLRQQASIEHTLHLVSMPSISYFLSLSYTSDNPALLADQNVHRTVSSFRNRLSSRPLYGEDIPVFPEPRALAEWCLSRIETWGATASMETFNDYNPSSSSRATVVLGGKVLVIDVDLDLGVDFAGGSQNATTTDSKDLSSKLPGVKVVSFKTSFALDGTTVNGSGNKTDGLDAFLNNSLSDFLDTVRKGSVDAESTSDTGMETENTQDDVSIHAARLGYDMQTHLGYLMMLDKLAATGGNYGGVRWFIDTDQLNATLERVAMQEAGNVASYVVHPNFPFVNLLTALCHHFFLYVRNISSALTAPAAPLDIFLLRAHALPLPYLVAPVLSFLVHVSPLVYLSFSRSVAAARPRTIPKSSLKIDIPMVDLRSFLTTHPRLPGVTMANLVLIPLEKAPILGGPEQDTGKRAAKALRPNFPLHPGSSDVNHVFPHFPSSVSTTLNYSSTSGHPGSSSQIHHSWFLDFTSSGRLPGVVMSQGRMFAIESTLRALRGQTEGDNSCSGLEGLGVGGMANMDMGSMGLGTMGNVNFGISGTHMGGSSMSPEMDGGAIWSGSWLDMLFTGSEAVSYERYKTMYRSPSNAHPPLELHLLAPQEPGFYLDRVPVRNMKEVWAILEIVKEQCWLNAMLTTVQWAPDSPPYYNYVNGNQTDTTSRFTKQESDNFKAKVEYEDEGEATEATLQALLSGTFRPRFIPVTVYIPSLAVPYSSSSSVAGPPPDSAHDSLFDSPTTGDMSIPGLSDSLPDPLSAHLPMPTPPRLEPPPSIVITSPERAPITGMVELRVTFDTSRPQGVKIELNGALGADVDVGTMEEVCRRGGLFGLPGRVWRRGE